MIAIVDYGMGNLGSVQKGFEHVGAKAEIVNQAKEIEGAEHIVLPGVGAFGDAMRNLKKADLIDPIIGAISEGRPFLGICLGLQLMFSESEEMGQHGGLNVMPGCVRKFPQGDRIPQIGWNQVHIQEESPLFEGVPDGSFFYFVHSFYVDPQQQSHIVGMTEYGIDYVSVAGDGCAFGVQFHPEKSQDAGLKLLQNFSRLKA